MKRLGLFLEAEPSAGGIFQYSQAMLEAIAALSQHGYELEIACASHAWAPLLEDRGFHVTWLRHAKLGLNIAKLLNAFLMPGSIARAISAAINPIAWQLNRLRCDIWIHPAPDSIAYQLPLPSIVAIHDLMHRYEGQFREVGGGYRYYVRDHRFGEMTHWAKGVLVDSEVGLKQVVDSYGVNAAKIYPLPYIPPRTILDPQAGDVSTQYRLPEKYFFYPAQLWTHKNHKRLISAGARLIERFPDIQFIFTGRGRHDYEEIVDHARATGMLEHITFLDYVPAQGLPALYRRARALVMPTFLGPTNIPPLEAFSCDCPVAISGIYGMPDQLGNAALYFDPKSVEEIADVLERLWIDDALCDTLRARGRSHTANWNQGAFNRRLAEIIEQVGQAAP